MLDWPVPSQLATQLTTLLRKYAFLWTVTVEEAFQKLMVNPPVLSLPNFTKKFVIEYDYDACGVGIGVVLMQNQQLLAFLSQALKGRNLLLSTYEKALLAMELAFVVRTYHHSLKYLFEQKVGTPTYQKWISKLLGYEFSIEFKSGTDNRVIDALSRCISIEEDEMLANISFPNPI